MGPIEHAQRHKLPVPGPWRSAVEAAAAHLAGRLTVARADIAVTRIEPVPGATAADGIFDVWLLARARTWRYRVGPRGAEPVTA